MDKAQQEAIQKAIKQLNDSLPKFPVGDITFTFRGGPRDGETVSSVGTPKGQGITPAQWLWVKTRSGTVGELFQGHTTGYTAGLMQGTANNAAAGKGPTEPVKLPQGEALGIYDYRVAEREVAGEDVNVICQYVGINPDSVIKPPAP